MKATDLIVAFEDCVTLPIDVNKVLEHLKGCGCDDDIAFVGADLDAEILQGAIKIWHHRNGVYADPKRCANIYYHRGLSKDWQRIISCKEMFHLLDPDGERSSSPEAIYKLAEEIGLPPEMQDPVNEGLATNSDRIAEWRAAAVLLPWAARAVLKPYYDRKELSLADIARQADIPSRYAGMVMHSVWEKVYPVLRGLD